MNICRLQIKVYLFQEVELSFSQITAAGESDANREIHPLVFQDPPNNLITPRFIKTYRPFIIRKTN